MEQVKLQEAIFRKYMEDNYAQKKRMRQNHKGKMAQEMETDTAWTSWAIRTTILPIPKYGSQKKSFFYLSSLSY